MALGLVAFVFDTIGGVYVCKAAEHLSCRRVRKLTRWSAAQESLRSRCRARVIQKMALKEDNQNHLLMHAVGANVAGQIGSVIAGGIILALVPDMIRLLGA